MSRMHATQFQMPMASELFTPAVTTVLVLSVIGFVLTALKSSFVVDWFAVSPHHVLRGRIWQLVTYPFVLGDPLGFIFNTMIILFVGSAVEREWRSLSFVSLWLVTSVVCGILWILAGQLLFQPVPGVSSQACCYSLMAVLGVLMRGRRVFMFVATVEVQVMVLIFIGLGILLSLLQPITLMWVFGAAVGYLYVKWMWKADTRRAHSHGRSAEAYQPDSFVDVD